MAGSLREDPSLTALRVFAALWVMVCHAWVEAVPRLMLVPLGFTDLDITSAFSMGWIGVDIFFSLSAFLLALPFVSAARDGRPKPRLRDYFQRRFLRILPAYYVQLALVLAFVWFVENRLAITPSAIAAHAALWLNIGSQPVAPLVGVWWTLPIEFGYYLLLPFLVPLLTPKRCLWLLLGAIGITLAYRYGMFQHAVAQGYSVGEKVLLLEQLPGRIDQFVLGSIAAVWIAHQPDYGRNLDAGRARSLTIVGVAVVVLMMALLHWNVMTYWEGNALLFCFHLIVSLGVTAFIIGACSDQHPDLRMLRLRPFVFLGTISYSVYLWHQLIIQWLGKQDWIFVPTPYILPTLLLVGVPMTLIAAWLSWRIIEQPCLAWGRSAFGKANSGSRTAKALPAGQVDA